MEMKQTETILTQWRELERELESADEDSREEIQARIAELRDRYQALVYHALIAEVEEIDAAGGLTEGSTGAA
jgi:hypothetical protein